MFATLSHTPRVKILLCTHLYYDNSVLKLYTRPRRFQALTSGTHIQRAIHLQNTIWSIAYYYYILSIHIYYSYIEGFRSGTREMLLQVVAQRRQRRFKGIIIRARICIILYIGIWYTYTLPQRSYLYYIIVLTACDNNIYISLVNYKTRASYETSSVHPCDKR